MSAITFDSVANFSASTVAVPPNPPSSGTSLTLEAEGATLFPSPPFNVTVWPANEDATVGNAEIMRVTGVSGDTFTVVREQEVQGLIRTVLKGDQIALTVTAKTVTDVQQGINSAISSASSALASEVSRAEGAEAANASNIATNASAISVERTRAQSAEQTNASNIAANSTAISNEVTRATTAEASKLGVAVQSLGNIGSAQTISFGGVANSRIVASGTLTSNATVTVSGRASGCELLLNLTQDSTGGRSLSLSDGTNLVSVPLTGAAGSTSSVQVECPNSTDMYVNSITPGAVSVSLSSPGGTIQVSGSSSAPTLDVSSSVGNGTMVASGDTGLLWNGTAWVSAKTLAAPSGMTAQDLLIGSSATGVARVPVGAAGQQAVVRSDGTIGYVDNVISATAWGVKADGSTDDTAAWSAALTAAAARSATVQAHASANPSMITSITIPANVTLRGSTGPSYVGVPGFGSIIRQSGTGSTAAITMAGSARLERVMVWGQGNADCIAWASQTNVVRECTAYGGNKGINCQYHNGQIVGCFINTNGVGVYSPVDTMIRGNYINANTNAGINGPSGSNDNLISGNKIEFNAQQNVLFSGSVNNTIFNNVIDRSGYAGIHLYQCGATSICGNAIRRSGANSSSSAALNTHIHVESCAGTISIIGNVTNSGANDNGTGLNSPSSSLYLLNNTGTILALGNDFTGFASGGSWLSNGGGNTGQFLHLLNNIGGSGELALGGKVAFGSNGNTGTVAASGGSTTVGPFSAISIGNYSPGYSYHLEIVARDTSTGSRSAARIPFVIGREGSNASVQAGAVINEIGTLFATSGSTGAVVTSTCATDGSTISFTLTNNGADPLQFSATLV